MKKMTAKQMTLCGVMAALVYFAGNLPFVLVQRYNRPRLRRLLEKTKNREAEVR